MLSVRLRQSQFMLKIRCTRASGAFIRLKLFCARVCATMTRQDWLLIAFCMIAFGAFGMVHAQSHRGITPEDYFSFQFISDPHFSPDGSSIAYELTTVDGKKNRRDSSIWLVSADGSSQPRRLSAEGSSSHAPRWSPDGKTLAIVSARNSNLPTDEAPTAQIYLLPVSGGGEAFALTRLRNGVESYQWSPDGSRIVVVSAAGPLDSIAPADRKSDVRHYKHIQFNFNDTGWYDDKRLHLWIVDVATGEMKQITDGQDWNDADPQWSPDGTRIAFVSDRTGKLFDESHNTDVWVVPATGGALTKISDHEFADESPRWSQDGANVLFTGKTAYHQFFKLYVTGSSGSSPSKMVLKDLDLVPTELHWSRPDEIVFVALTRGESQIFRGNLSSKVVSAVTRGPRGVRGLDIDEKTNEMAYVASDFQHLDDLYVSNLDGSSERKLTHLNSTLWSQLELQPVERLPYKSTDRRAIEGFFVKPLGWQPARKYPMVLVIHGGPRDMFGVYWYHEMQVYAAKGWAVFYCNPRGSLGYGEEFERAEINNWGVMDYQDIMSGVDAALKQNPWIDTSKLGVTGGSYGGYMTNWIISHTDRFEAAVTLRATSNFISVDGTRDGAYGHEEYFKGTIFEAFDQYWEASPLKHARDVHTPTLILHSDMDLRMPLEQGEQWFRALQHYGVPSEFVIFPRENHNLTRTGEPKNLVESLNWQLYWFDRYLNGNSGAKPPDAP
jgi:dipeptidyl aminopeptidase/acylaminoacyl peptidase